METVEPAIRPFDALDTRPRPRAREETGEAIFGSWNSEIVPHCPQLGQRPYHCDPLHPHSEQRKILLGLDILERYRSETMKKTRVKNVDEYPPSVESEKIKT
jgi:hypothetical protein